MHRIPLAVLLGCLFWCQPSLAQSTPCPCWPVPDTDTGVCSDTQLPLFYSTSESSETYTQCVNKQGYDAQFGEW